MGSSSYWRCVYAVDVWHWGGIRQIILSGDRETTASMRTWILGQGVPAAAVTIEVFADAGGNFVGDPRTQGLTDVDVLAGDLDLHEKINAPAA